MSGRSVRRVTPPAERDESKREKRPPISKTTYININTAIPETRIELGFLGHSVEISNYSGRWLYFRSIDLFIPPRIIGLIVNKAVGFHVLTLGLEVPLGDHDIRDSIQSLCIVTVLDRAQIASPGFMLRDIPKTFTPIEVSEGVKVNPSVDTLLASTFPTIGLVQQLVGHVLIHEETNGATNASVIIQHRNGNNTENVQSIIIPLFPGDTLIVPYPVKLASSEILRVIMGATAVGADIDVQALILLSERGPLYAV